MQKTESKARIVYNVPGLIKQYIEHVSYGFLTAELVKRDWGHTALIFKLNKALVGNKDLCIDVNGHVFTGKDPSILKVDTTAGLTLTGKDLYLDGTAAHLSRTAAPVTMRIMCNHFVDGLTRKRISAETIEYEIEATTETVSTVLYGAQQRNKAPFISKTTLTSGFVTWYTWKLISKSADRRSFSSQVICP